MDLSVQAGEPSRSEVLNLGELIDAHLAHLKIMVQAGINKNATREWYSNQFKHLATLRATPAATLRTHHLASIELTNAFVRALKALFKWAADEEQAMIPRNPFAKLTVPECGRRERTLTRAELRSLYLAAPRALRRLLFVQLRTIARPGEIRDLTWSQIDWDRRVLVLKNFKGKKKRRDKLKAREIPLVWPALRMLRNLHRKATDMSPESRVFRSPRYGRPWTANGVRCAMRVARVKAGLDGGDEPVVCYTLRHTGATDLLRAGTDLKLLAEVMGHTRTTTTERYVHLDSSDMLGAVDRAAARQRSPRAGGLPA